MATESLTTDAALTDPNKLPIQSIQYMSMRSRKQSAIMNNISLCHTILWILTMLICVSCTVLVISILPWYNSTFPQNYFKTSTYILLEDTFQPFILCIIGPLTISIMYSPEFTLVILYQIGVPSAVLFVGFFTIIYWIFDVSLVWYCIDGPILCIQYILICTAAVYRLAIIHKKVYHNSQVSNNNQTTYSTCKLIKYVVVPITWLFLTIGIFGGPGLEFFLSLSAEYQFLFRTLVWPPLIQCTLVIAEKLLLKCNTNVSNSSKLHAVLLAQAVFAIYGRVMIFSGKNLKHAIFLALGHCVQEILFHHWSRQISRANFEIKMKCLRKICCGKCCNYKVLTFEEYFNSVKKREYRCYTINIEYLIEIIGVISTALMFTTFYKYHYVFNFDYPLNEDGTGIDVKFVVCLAGIQILMELLSYLLVFYIENRFNNVHLLRAWGKWHHLQMLSSILIMIEAVVSAATVTRSVPNIINCTNRNDVCSCSFATDWNGCN
eukprot:143818_1